MFTIGRQVYRERLPVLVDDRMRRRVRLVGVVVGAVAFVGLLLLGLLTDVGEDLPPVAGIVVALLLAVALGCFGAGLVPIGPKGWELPPVPRIGWRTQEAIARYHRRNPPPVAPEHRDAVLQGMPETRDMIVRVVFRGNLLLAGWGVGLLGTVLLNVFTLSAGDTFTGFIPVYFLIPVLSSYPAIGGVRLLGRQEQLRVEAEALPPVPPPPPARGRPGTPSGSKLALPGE
ncbi:MULTISPECIES: hypothetical protein [unclassified Curtobacterium]|uniref:hypothetical protein n=1 Tax=unclassified Curtobacterium TaxID=257496 RepID=UPI0008DDFC81|nr:MULTISPECIES: hypothetical protein [unclassified Curtobacterium]OIH95720.1 hypothetical protein BIU92_04260 [Curtobacterium sp. MCBA15_003]OII15824.1 hypothetical protein BIU97_14240 [Curtobacterium sp. MCBA15_009]OII31289.1 hypothetical protein BIU94_04815 [Curtobacterium sp. MMLR14_006]